MKKTFTLLALALSTGVFAQSFALYHTSPSGAITSTIYNNGGFLQTTTPAASAITDYVLVKNLAATSQSFGCIRSIVAESPNLVLNGTSTTPNTYFCFGNTCFGSNTSMADPANYTVLMAAGQSSPNATEPPYYDNSKQNGQPFVIYFNEATAIGHYTVRYKVYVVGGNDTISFNVGYNQLSVGIKNQSAAAAELVSDLYPNPANGSKVYFNLAKEEDLKFQVYNSLGGLVSSSSKQKYQAGKNQLPVEAELSNGLYFVNISTGSATVTRRLIITGK